MTSNSSYTIQRWIVYALFIGIFILPLLINPDMMWGYHASKELFLQLFTCIASVLFAIYLLLTNNSTKFQYNILDIFVSIIPAYYLILHFFINQYFHALINIKVMLGLIIFYWLIHFALNSKKEMDEKIHLLKTFFVLMLIIVTIESVIGLFQVFDIIQIRRQVIYETVLIGTMGNANAVGGLIAVMIPGILFLIKTAKQKKQKNLYIIALILSLIVLLLTKSRGAWIGLITGFLVYNFEYIVRIWKKLINKLNKYIIILVSLVILIAAGFAFHSINPESGAGRIFIWKVTALMIKDHPFLGIGPNNYEVEYLNYQAKYFAISENKNDFDFAANIKQAHNQYFEILAETGLIGLLFVLTLLAIFIYMCIKLLVHKDKRINSITKVFLSSMAIFVIHSLVDSPFHYLASIFFFVFNISIISFLYKNYINDFSIVRNYEIKILFTQNLRNVINIILVIIIVFLATFWSISIYEEFRAYEFWNNGMQQTMKKNWTKGIENYRTALEYSDNFYRVGELHFHLAGAYVMNGNYEKALPHFMIARKTFNDKNVYISEGMANQRLNRYNESEKCYLKTIGMFPNLLFPKWLLSTLYYEHHEYDKAKELLKFIVNANPKIENKDSRAIQDMAKQFLERIMQEAYLNEVID